MSSIRDRVRDSEGVVMTETQGGFPGDWLASRPPIPATDLEIALLLVNSLDLLDDPPDRLHNLDWFGAALGRVGHSSIADELTARDLPRLRALRDVLREAWEATDDAAAAEALNRQLNKANAIFLLVNDGDKVSFAPAPDRTGFAALAARLPAALAIHIAEYGVRRLGVCSSDPCRCAFVDRTRAGTRRYCCGYCNDRHAARAYRKRRRTK